MRKRPMRLQKGDTVGIIAPASPPNKERLQKALVLLEELGLEYVIGESVDATNYYLAGTDEMRLNDLHTMIEDTRIKAIFCASGGYGSARIADKVDYLLLEENPKIFWGFSDITFLHSAFGMFSDIVTFHGPTLSSLGRDNVPERTKRMLEQLFLPAEIYYTNDISPLQTIAEGVVRGQLVGGNLTTIASALGTKFDLDVRGKVLLIEDIGLEPAQIDSLLNQLRMARKFDECAGIVIGDFTDAAPREYNDSPTLDALFTSYFAQLNKPVVSGFKFGHDDLNVAIPLGVDVILNADEQTLALLPGVE